MDCDGVLTNDDCNDNNTFMVVSLQIRFDGVLTNQDRDDNNENITTLSSRNDCQIYSNPKIVYGHHHMCIEKKMDKLSVGMLQVKIMVFGGIPSMEPL